MEAKAAKQSDEKSPSGKENSSTPLGVKFEYGIPGREILNKNRVEMPPRTTLNSPRGARGGHAGRGFGSRGRGQNHGNQGRFHVPPPKGKPTEKKVVDEKAAPDSCEICDRPCTTVLCGACGYTGSNLRVKTDCAKHPRVIRLQDLKVCPQCKTENIEEKSPEAEP